MSNNPDTIDSTFNVYVGSDTGVLKGIRFGTEAPVLKNFHTFQITNEIHSIKCLNWVDDSKRDILVAFESNMFKVYNTKLKSFTRAVKTPTHPANILNVLKTKDSYIIGFEDGNITCWTCGQENYQALLSTGKQLSSLKQCSINRNIFATGGKENDLKVWDASGGSIQPIFSARNVAHDELDLRVPVWVQDMTFLPQSSELVASCTRYGQVRLYDPKVNNKQRPVINYQFMDHPLMSISSTSNNRQVLVGSSQGKMGLIDLRNGNKGSLVHQFGGFSGSIRSIYCHPDSPYFVSCGLDRHLYLHHLDQKKPLKKLFLKSRLNSVLMTDDFVKDFEGDQKEDSTVQWQNIEMEHLSSNMNESEVEVIESCSSKKRRIK